VVADEPGPVPVPTPVVVALDVSEERREEVVVVVDGAAGAQGLEELSGGAVVAGQHVVRDPPALQLLHVLPRPHQRRH